MNDKSQVPSRIVVRGTNWVGDTIISLPALREVRRIFPSSTVWLWVKKDLEGLIRAAQVADELMTFDQGLGGPIRRPFRMGSRLATRKFDLAILLQNAFESALTAWVARIPLRAGYPTDLRGSLLNIRVPLNPNIRLKHQVFYYLGITEFVEGYFCGGSSMPNEKPDCSIRIPEQALDEAQSILAEHFPDSSGPIFCLCAGSVNSEAKRWPADYFARLADLMVQRIGARVVFLGSSQEEALIERIVSSMRNPGAANLAGKADILISMAIMNLSTGVVSNDTGSAHLAVAASAMILTLFGPTSPGATAPYGSNAHILKGEAKCAPCRQFRCPLPDHPCMRSLEPERVMDELIGLVERTYVDHSGGIARVPSQS